MLEGLKCVISILYNGVVLTKIFTERSSSKFMVYALFIIDCKRSAAKTKSKGDRGSPCLTPLLHLMGLPSTPFKST
jgi:hypothetical protein